jgi:hypothetical protein
MPVCLAWQNPVDTAGDTIRRNTNNAVDDALSKIRQETHQVKKDIKAAAKSFLSTMLEIFTIVSICWLFGFLVDKKTAKMCYFVGVVLGLNELIKLFV